MKRVALALLTTTVLAFEAGYTPTMLASTSISSTPKNIEQSSQSYLTLAKATPAIAPIFPQGKISSHEKEEFTGSQRQKEYKPVVPVGMPERREGGGTR